MREHTRTPVRGRACLEILEGRTLLSSATVNFSTVYQTIDGFGTESNYGSNPIPSATLLQEAYSQTNGIGLDFVRGSMNANGSNRQVAWDQKAAAYGVQFIASPRGPAVSWLTNVGNATNGSLDPSHYQDYANLLGDFIQNSAAQGIPIGAISMAVEPDMATSITPVWTGQQFAALLPYVGQAFQSRGITTKIMVNEDVGQSQADRSQIMADPDLSQYVSILADHGYDQTYDPYVGFTNAQGRPNWMTENIPQTAGNTAIQNALQAATDIHNAMTVGNVSAYLYYWMSYLMSSGDTPNASFWALGNYSKFVQSGWVRVGETDDGGLSLTTFNDPVSGRFAIVAINSGSSAVTESYTLNGVNATSVTPYLTSAYSNLAQQSSVAVANNVFSATIGAQSIVTYYGQATGSAVLQTPVRLAAATAYGAQTSQIALSWTDNSTSETSLTFQRSTSATNWTNATAINLAAGTKTYVDTGLAEATTYYYRIAANNGTSSTTWSSVATGSTILAAPSGLTVTAASGGNTLSWTRVSGVSAGSSVQRSIDGLTWTSIGTVSGASTTFSDTIAGYNSNQIYWYRVRNTAGSLSSAYIQINTTVNAPANFKATLLTATSVQLTWANSSVGAYAAYISENNSQGNVVSPVNLSANANTYVVTGLTENAAYTFSLNILGPDAWYRPSVGSQYGAWSSTVSVSTTTAVAAPTNLTAVSSTAGTAVLTWTDNSAVETGEDVQRSTNGTTWTDLTTTRLAANTTTYNDSSAPASGTVYYRVKAIASSVSSNDVRTQMVSAVPKITTAPTVTGTATSLSAAAPVGFGSGSLTYTWSLDGAPPGAVTFSANGTTAAASTTATFVAAGSYLFRVTIADAAGNTTSVASTVSVTQTATTVTVQDNAAKASYGGPAEPTPSIAVSTYEPLSAIAYDQFGNLLSAPPSFAWSIASGAGSVSNSGLYTATSSASTPVVQAVTGSVSGQITLNVVTSATLLAYLTFNETSGYTLSNTGSAGIPAKMSGGTSLVPGRSGNAVAFDGQSGSVWLGVPGSQEPAALDIRGQITMAAWIMPISATGTQTIISRGYGSYPYWGGTFLRIAGGQYQVGYYTSSGFHNAAFTMPPSDVGHWVNLVGTYDGKNWNLYRNGTLVATYGSTLGAIYSNNDWRVGSSDIPADYFNGEIDDVRLYGQALSASQVGNLFAATPTTLSLQPNGPTTSNATQAVTFTATLGGGVPDGSTVTLQDTSNGNAVVASGVTSSGVVTLTIPAGTLLAGTHSVVAVYAGSVNYLASQSTAVAQVVQVVVTGVQVNGNLASLSGVQRSMVDSVVYTFSEPVSIATAGAFTIAAHSGQTGTVPTLGWAAVNPNSSGASTQWVVTFSGAGVVGGSIANGVYDIAIVAAAISSAANSAVNAQSRTADTFFRLYGDINGDGRVTSTDNNAFLSTYGLRSGVSGYLAAFDANGDGKISSVDANVFSADYGLRYSGFTPTA